MLKKRMLGNWQDSKGQSLIEVLIALSLITIALVALVSRTVESARNANFSQNQNLATKFAQEGIEWSRSQRDRLRWDPLVAAVTDPTTYCLLDLSDQIGGTTTSAPCAANIGGTIFKREVTFDFEGAVPITFVDVTVVVTWDDSVGVHDSTLTTRLSDWIN